MKKIISSLCVISTLSLSAIQFNHLPQELQCKILAYVVQNVNAAWYHWSITCTNKSFYALSHDRYIMEPALVTFGNTPQTQFDNVCRKNFVTGLRYLLEAKKNKINIERTYSFGENMLHVCARNGNVYIMKQLLPLMKKKSLHTINSTYQTPLHVAVKNKNSSIVRLLLSYDCNLEYTDIHGQTPMQLAKENGYWFIFTLLLKHIGKKVLLRCLSKSPKTKT